MNRPTRFYRLDPPHPAAGGNPSDVQVAGKPSACLFDLEEWAALSGQVVFLVDQEGTILEVSSTISQLLGVTKETLCHRPFEMLTRTHRPGEGSEKSGGKHLLKLLRQNGSLPRWDLVVEDAMQQTRILRCRGRVIKQPGGGEPLYLIIASDLTALKNSLT